MLHIHANAFRISESAAGALAAAGFDQVWFAKASMDPNAPCPERHFTRKVSSGGAFKTDFTRCIAILKADPTFVGFVEGERIVRETTLNVLPETSKQERVLSPLKLAFAPWQNWRECEIHISLAAGDDYAQTWLANLGLSSVVINKANAPQLVFSVQGKRSIVEPLFDQLASALQHQHCKLTLERSAGHWISPGFALFPPQLEKVSLEP